MTEEKPRNNKAQPPTEPYVDMLTPEEIEDLRADKKRVGEYARRAFAHLRPNKRQINSGIDPELLIDGMTIAGAYIESGVRKFDEFAKAMIDDLGDGIKPYLLSFYEGVRSYPGLDTAGMSTPDEAKAALDLFQSEKQNAAEAEKSDTAEKTGKINAWITLAFEHWKEHLPKRFKAERKAGKLNRSLKWAAEQTYSEISSLLQDGFTPDEAWEMVREKYLILRAEPYVDDEKQEPSAALEAMREMNELMQELNEVD